MTLLALLAAWTPSVLGAGDLVVETVDAAGAPVGGVPVVLRGAALLSWSWRSVCARATTDASGRAVFADVESLRRGKHAGQFPSFTEVRANDWSDLEWRVQIDSVPIASGAYVQLGRELPTEVVRLSTANLAELHVVAVDSTGAPTSDAAEVLVTSTYPSMGGVPQLSIAETDSSRGVQWLDYVRSPLIGGEATLPWIGVRDGVSVFVRRNALSDWSGVSWKNPDGAQPNRVEVELAAGLRTFVLQPTLDRRRPSPSAVRARRTVRERASYANESVPLDRRAVVREWWAEEPNGGDYAAVWTPFEAIARGSEAEVVLDTTSTRLSHLDLAQIAVRTEDGGERCAVLSLAKLSAEPKVVVPAPLSTRDAALSGVVVDSRGNPVSDASVYLEDSYWNYSFDFDVPSVLRLAPTTTDSLGRFSLPYPPAQHRRIVVSGSGLFPESQPAETEPVLRVVIERMQSLRGYIRVSDPDAARDLNILLLRDDSSESKSTKPGLTVGCSCDGLFQFDRVTPGTHTLIVRRARYRQPPLELFRREGLVLESDAIVDIGEIPIE